LVQKFVKNIKSSFVTETIDNKEQCLVLQQMMKDEDLKTFNVIIQKFGGQSSAS
jgi:hypothetical protein